MKIVILAEKLSAFLSAARSVAAISPPGATIVGCLAHPYNLMAPLFVFPRGLSLRDYPHSKTPAYRAFSMDGWKPSFSWHTAEPSHGGDGWTTYPLAPSEGEAENHFSDADRIVVMMDADATSALLTRRILDQMLALGHADPRVVAPLLLSWEDDVLTKAFSAECPYSDGLGQFAARGVVRQRFDYNFAMNANVILRPIQHMAGMPADAPPMSKYAVQTLYACRGLGGGVSEGKLIDLMSTWKGTGKYPKTFGVALGSPASRASIVKALKETGLLEVSDEGKRSLVRISDTGLRMLDLLHPDCEDTDLPFRIDAWSLLPEEEGKAKVDRYIRTFFGKMGRYARRREANEGLATLMSA